MRNLRRVGMKLAFSSVVFLALLFSIDLLLQFMLPIPQAGSGRWAGPPRMTMQFLSKPDSFETTHSYNSAGFRGPEISLSRTKKHRIVCIGDSWTEGIGAHENQAWPSVLRRNLSSNVEVINLGHAGATAQRYLDILCQVGIPLKPTHCIMCVIPSDFYKGPELPVDPSVRSELRDDFRERDSKVVTGLANTLPGWVYLVDRAQGKWHPRSGLYWADYTVPREKLVELIAETEGVELEEASQLFESRLAMVDPVCLEAAEQRAFNGFRIDLEIFNPHASFRCRTIDQGIDVGLLEQKSRTWIRFFAKTCRDANVQPMLMFFPEAGLVDNRPTGPFLAEHYQDAPNVTADNSLSGMVAKLCEELDVMYLDVTPKLRAANDRRLFLRYDSHPNEVAYGIVGEWLGKKLADLTSGQTWEFATLQKAKTEIAQAEDRSLVK